MKLKLFFAVVATFAFSFCAGQIKTFENCTDTANNRIVAGDTVVIACDRAYLINQVTMDTYKKTLLANRSCTEIVKTYAALSNLQDSQIVEQNRRFEEMKAKFDSLGNNTGQFLTITQGSLSQLNDTLANVANNIEETKQLLNETKILLENERKTLWKLKLRWGLGGFGIGLGITTVLFLVAR